MYSVPENGANLEGIEVTDAAYSKSISFAEPWSDGFYYLLVDNASLGDICITYNGEERQSVDIEHLTIRQHAQ